jgi:hypothetical protein
VRTILKVGAALVAALLGVYLLHGWLTGAPDRQPVAGGAAGSRMQVRALPPPALAEAPVDGAILVTGTVTLDGRPAPGARVALIARTPETEGNRQEVQASDDGGFSFRAEAPVRHLVVATHGDASGTLSLELESPDERRKAANLSIDLHTCRRWVGGIVTDANGHPLDAELHLESHDDAGWMTLQLLSRTEGRRFRICRDSGPVVATASGYASRWIDFERLSRTGRVELPPALRLRGQVARADGRRVSGAAVVATASYPEQRARVRQSVRADDGGAFELADLAPGCYLMTAQAEDGATSPLLEVCGGAGETRDDVALIISSCAALRGRLVSDGGLPVVGAKITSDEKVAYTQGDGTFRLGCPFLPTLLIRGFGEVALDGYALTGEEPFVEIDVGPVATISGTVLLDGAPVANALVSTSAEILEVFWNRNEVPFAVTDASGRYRLDVPRGTPFVLASDPATGARSSIHPVPRQQEEVTIELQPQAAIRGTVETSDGTSIRGVRVTLQRLGDRRDTFEELLTTSRRALTDDAGEFFFPGLDPARYVLRVSSPWSLKEQESVTIEVLAGEREATARLLVNPLATTELRGTVRFADGAPAAYAYVRLSGHGDTLTDAQGAFLFRELPQGSYQLSVRTADASARAVKEVVAGDEATIVIDR